MSAEIRAVFCVGLALGCAPAQDCETTLWYVDEGQADRVSVVGDWNGWNEDIDELKRVREGAWRLDLSLPEGDYAYAMWVDGELTVDPYAPLRTNDLATGEERSLLRVGSCSEPGLRLDAASASADGALSVEATFLRGEGGARLGEVRAWLASGGSLPVAARRAQITVETDGLPPGKHTVVIRAEDRDGAAAPALRVPLWVEETPFSWEGAVIYQVVIDRFASEEGPLPPSAPDEIGARMGGDLRGLLDVLESSYFADLGVSALWISPLYDNAEGAWPGDDGHDYEAYHGYWPVSPGAVEPHFGTADDVRALVDAAHAQGIRVLMDVVPNHVHEEHPYRVEHAGDGWFHEDPGCICGDYECPWSEDIETCWFTDYLPDLSWDHPDVVETVVADTADWAARFDLDGARIDAVPMMPRSAVRALVAGLRARTGEGPTRFFALGETFTGPGNTADIRRNLGPHGLDGQFEFPILWALRGFLAWRSADAADLLAAIEDSLAAWEGSGAVMSPFVGNHDMTRFLSEAARDDLSDPWGAPPPLPDRAAPFERLVAAQAVALTLPGAPVIYYGDEVGLAGANDPDCRRPMVFGDDLSMLQRSTLEAVGRIARARGCNAALQHGEFRAVYADGPVLAYLRDADDGAPALVVVNASDDDADVALDIPPLLRVDPGVAWADALSAEPLPASPAPLSTLSLSLPPRTARVYVPAPCVEPAGGAL